MNGFPESFRYRISPATEKYREETKEHDMTWDIVALTIIAFLILAAMYGVR